MIDLSHLTEEEQEKILAVLKRDADLKKRDTMRVKELHKTVRDKNRLKYLTGDWFYETKSRRHNDKIHGCDIIRASIRQRRPVTIFELSKLWAEKAGTTDTTSAPEESQRNPASTPENQSDGPRPAPQSKQRQNPFNNTPASPVFRGEGGSRRLSNGKAHAGTAPVGELLPSPESPIATLTNQSSESSEHSQGSPNPPRPVPRKRLLHVSPNSSVDNNEPAFKPSTVPSPKSILKQSPRSSPIRSPIRSPIGSSLVPLSLPRCPSAEPSQSSLDLPESPCSGSGTLDKKQVQFSGSVRGRNAARRRSSQDSVENDFLDGDVLVASDDEGSDSSSSSSSEEEEEVDVSSEAHSTSREDSPIFLDPPPRNDSRLSIYSQSSSDSSRVSNSRPVNGGVVVITGEWPRSTEGCQRTGSGESKSPELTGYHDNVAETPASKVPSRYATWTDTGKSSEQQPGPLSPKLTEVESYSFTKVLDWFRRNAGRYRRPRKRSRGDTIKVVEESACGTESKSSEETASSESRRASNTLPKTRRGLLSFFLRGHAIEPETTDTISPDTKEPEYVNTTSPDGKEPNTPDTTSIDAKEPNTPKTSSPDANEPETPTTTSLDTKELNTSKTTSPVAKDPDTAKTSSPDGNGPEIPTTTSLDSKELNTHRTTSRVVKESDTIDTTTPDAKEPDTPKTTSPAKDVESPSSEEGTIGQDVTLAQNERVATSTVEEIASHQPEEPEPSISDINSDSQSTLCNAIESCEEREQASSPELRSVCEAEHQDPIAPQSPEGTQDPPSQEDDFSDDQGYVVKAERVVVLEECDTSSEASSLKDMGTHAQGNSQNTTPVRGILKRPASRPMSFSKSMEDITTMPAREERMNSEQKSDHMLSMDNVSAAPPSPCSTLDTDQMKRMSASVPAFLQQESDERDSDCASDNSMNSPHHQWRLNSLTNNSVSGMSTTSSVSGSVMSIYSVDYGNVEVKGTIQFAMNYVEKLGEFHIFVVQCRDLAVAEPKRNRSDPYVKCYLLPDKAKLGKRKTSVKKKTFNPTFNEILRYKIPCEVLRSTILNLSVWHNDNFGRNSFLGEVDVDLNEWSITDTQMKHYLLRPRVVTQPSTEDHRGDLKVAVRFLPKVTQSKRASKSGELQIWVKECRNLPVVRGAIIDPFVKCTVLPDSFKKSRQKTRVAKKTADPVFNHTMVYDGLRPEDLCEICVELTVWDHDRLTNHFLGGCRLGLGTGKSYGTDVDWMDSSSEEAALWSQMMTSQGEWIEDVFPLRMLMMARSMSK